MGDLFGTAAPVYIWVGEPTGNEDAALLWIQHCFLEIFPQLGFLGRHGLIDLGWSILFRMDDSTFDGLERLLSRQIWTRVWTLQEALLSDFREAAVLVLGKCSINYRMFADVLCWLYAMWCDPSIL